jgi:2-polyprenyl-6-methoxyphenol hydroxylase-like FAD-dependent oxidoreductase
MHLAGRDIVVIGAGIGGLAAATALAQRRARVRLFEQAPALAEIGAGIQVAPNGVAVLEALGLRDAAEARASLPEAVELRDFRGGAPVARVPLGQACVARYGRPYWHFHRADLLAVLAAGATDAGVELHLGTRVAGVAGEASGVRVTATDGTATDAEIAVAADGLRSDVRQDHFSGAPPRFTGNVAWRGLVGAERLPEALRAPVARVTMGPGRHLVTYPLRGGRLLNVVAVEERAAWTAEGWTTPDDPEHLRSAFSGWEGDAAAVLAELQDCFLWGLFDHAPLARWSAGRLALLGDACHPMLPFLAQGATMALEDAWVLAARLDLAADPVRGLMAYEADRLPRTTRVQRAAARNGRLYHLRAGRRAVAHLGLRTVSALAPGLLAGRLDWLFGTDVTPA